MIRKVQSRLRKKGNLKFNSGLTLLECLVAISVIGVTSAVIAPVMIFSVATRVQSQKAEQALQLAKLEVDSIRIEVERGGDYSAFLDNYPKTPESEGTITATVAPATVATSLDSNDVTVAKAVNTDSDADTEFAVQVFRTEGQVPAAGTSPLGASAPPVAFKVGVRVYDNAALQQNSGSLLTDAASLSFTSGEGQRGLRPLAVLYADIIQSDQDLSLCEYRRYIDSTASTTSLECD